MLCKNYFHSYSGSTACAVMPLLWVWELSPSYRKEILSIMLYVLSPCPFTKSYGQGEKSGYTGSLWRQYKVFCEWTKEAEREGKQQHAFVVWVLQLSYLQPRSTLLYLLGWMKLMCTIHCRHSDVGYDVHHSRVTLLYTKVFYLDFHFK